MQLDKRLLDKRLLVRREVRARGVYFCAEETGLLTMVTAPPLSTVIFHPLAALTGNISLAGANRRAAHYGPDSHKWHPLCFVSLSLGSASFWLCLCSGPPS